MQKTTLTKLTGEYKAFFTDSFKDAATGEKYGNKTFGGGGKCEEGTVLTVEGATFVDNKQTIGQDVYNNLSENQKNSCEDLGNGQWKQDNSYYAVATSGVVANVSFTSFVSYLRYRNHLTDDEKKELEEKVGGKTIVAAKGGTLDITAKSIAESVKAGDNIKLAYRKIWAADTIAPMSREDKTTGEKQKLPYDVRLDVWVKE